MAMRRRYEAAAAPAAPDDGIDFSSVKTLKPKDKNVKNPILIKQIALFLGKDPTRRISKEVVEWFELGVNQNTFLNRCITQCEGITDAQRDSLFELTEKPLDQGFFDMYFYFGEKYVEKGGSGHKVAVLKWAAKHGYTTINWVIEEPVPMIAPLLRKPKTTGLMVPTWRCGLTLGPTRQDNHVSRAPWKESWG